MSRVEKWQRPYTLKSTHTFFFEKGATWLNQVEFYLFSFEIITCIRYVLSPGIFSFHSLFTISHLSFCLTSPSFLLFLLSLFLFFIHFLFLFLRTFFFLSSHHLSFLLCSCFISRFSFNSFNLSISIFHFSSLLIF